MGTPLSRNQYSNSVNRANGHAGVPRLHSTSRCADWQLALARMEGAYSANTIRSYRADFTIFEAWCRQEHRAALPATPETVAEFVLAQSKSAAPATVSRRRAAITKIHRLLKLDSPVSSEEVNLATRKVFRQRGRRQDQALGLTSTLKKRLIAACPHDLRGFRDSALIAVGYDTLCRRAELVQLQIDDLTVTADGFRHDPCPQIQNRQIRRWPPRLPVRRSTHSSATLAQRRQPGHRPHLPRHLRHPNHAIRPPSLFSRPHPQEHRPRRRSRQNASR